MRRMRWVAPIKGGTHRNPRGAAVFAHGLYDYIVVGKGWIEGLRIWALLIVVFMVIAYRKAVANGLSGSQFWNEKTDRKVINHWWYLSLALSGVVLIEYLLLAWNFGPTAAGLGFLAAAMSSVILILILTSHLGLIEVTRHRWLPLFDRRDFYGRNKRREKPN